MVDIEEIGRFIFGSIIAISLIVPAFQVGFLVGIGYLTTISLSVYNLDWMDAPGLSVIDFSQEIIKNLF